MMTTSLQGGNTNTCPGYIENEQVSLKTIRGPFSVHTESVRGRRISACDRVIRRMFIALRWFYVRPLLGQQAIEAKRSYICSLVYKSKGLKKRMRKRHTSLEAFYDQPCTLFYQGIKLVRLSPPPATFLPEQFHIRRRSPLFRRNSLGSLARDTNVSTCDYRGRRRFDAICLEDGVAVCGDLALLFEGVLSVFWWRPWRGLEFFFLIDARRLRRRSRTCLTMYSRRSSAGFKTRRRHRKFR